MLHIGLPKNNLIDNSHQLISGLLGQKVDPNRLYYATPDGRLGLHLLKHRDIPRLIAGGFLDAGITAMEWVVETGVELRVALELDWCDNRISLLGPSDSSVFGQAGHPRSCVTEFPNLAKNFFVAKGWSSCNIWHISGSSEGLVPSLFDCTVDCVQTGATARLHNLREVETLLESKTVFVTQPELDLQEIELLIQEVKP